MSLAFCAYKTKTDLAGDFFHHLVKRLRRLGRLLLDLVDHLRLLLEIVRERLELLLQGSNSLLRLLQLLLDALLGLLVVPQISFFSLNCRLKRRQSRLSRPQLLLLELRPIPDSISTPRQRKHN